MTGVTRTVGVKAKLLVDTAEYVLGIARETSKPARVAQAHQAFIDLVEECARTVGEPAVGAVRAFLASGAEIGDLPDDFDAGAELVHSPAGSAAFAFPDASSGARSDASSPAATAELRKRHGGRAARLEHRGVGRDDGRHELWRRRWDFHRHDHWRHGRRFRRFGLRNLDGFWRDLFRRATAATAGPGFLQENEVGDVAGYLAEVRLG